MYTTSSSCISLVLRGHVSVVVVRQNSFACIVHYFPDLLLCLFSFNSTLDNFTYGYRLCGESRHNGGVPSSVVKFEADTKGNSTGYCYTVLSLLIRYYTMRGL